MMSNKDGLRMVIEYQGKKAYLDFRKYYNSLHESLKRSGINKQLDDVRLDDEHLLYHYSYINGKYYEKVAELTRPDDRLFDIFKVCHILQDADKEFFNYLDYRIEHDKIKSISDIYVTDMIYRSKKIGEKYKANWDFDANKIMYSQYLLFNKHVLFTPSRIDSSTLPKGIYKYEIRDDMESQGIWSQIGKSVLVNFWGTILSSTKIELGQNGLKNIDEAKDVIYLDKQSVCLKKYIINKMTLEK